MASADLRKMLECSVCLSVYKDPVILKCGHNFCRKCISRVLDTQEESGGHSCPECRQEFQKRPALLRNITLRNIAEGLPCINPDQNSGIFCTYCMDYPTPAVKSCLLCEASLCERHLRVHSTSPEHIITDTSLSLENRTCPVHKKILEYYCTEDAACICVYCSAQEHRRHNVVSLDEASENKKKELREVLLKLTSRIKVDEERIWDLRELRRKISEEETSVQREKVVALFRDIRRQLEDLEEKVLAEVTLQVEQVELSVSDLIGRQEIQKDELSRTIRHIEELCNTTDPLTVLQESETGDLCYTKETASEDRERLLRDVGNWDVTGTLHALHTGLSDIITGVHAGIYIPACSDVSLDVDTARILHISEDRKTAAVLDSYVNYPETPERFQNYAQVMGSQSFSSGRHYWEMDVGGSYRWRAGMCYPSIARKGVPESWIGYNDKSWCLEKCNDQYSVIHDSHVIQIPANVTSNKVRVYLDYEAGQLSLYDLCHPIKHLHTFTAKFTQPLHVALALWEGGRIQLSGHGM